MTWLGTGHVFGLNWQDMGHLYAALVGFSIGVWVVTVAAFIREIRSLYVDGRRSWRLPLGLSCWVAALGLYSGAVATALNNPKSDIPVWRLSIYWTALILADLGVGMLSWHIRRHGVNPDIRSTPPRARSVRR